MKFNEVINQRCSVRRFKDDFVSDELIDEILEVGRIAPTAGNQQPVVVGVLKENSIKKLEACSDAKVHPVVFRTKQVLLICYDKEKEMKRPHDNYVFGNTDADIVTTYMMLKITELGLGSTWIGWFDPELVKKTLNLSDNYVVVSMLAFGYPLDDMKPSRLHNERKDMSEFNITI